MPKSAAAAVCGMAALVLPHDVGGTAPHLCGEACGALWASRPHSDSCWRGDSLFSFDIQPHYHVCDACFGENDPSAPFYFNGVYHMMWQSHTQYEHVPSWNCRGCPGAVYGDTGISFGHAVSSDLAHWTQLPNALWPDRWFASASVYDGSATVIAGVPTIIAAGLTPNSTSPFCHARATPANLSDPFLVGWLWDPEPLYCGTRANGLVPYDAPTGAWRTPLGQWMYQDGTGAVYVSDDGEAWRGGRGRLPNGMVTDWFPLPPACDGCGALPPEPRRPTHVHEAANSYSLGVYTPSTVRDAAGNVTVLSDGGATVANGSALGLTARCDHGSYGFPKSFWDPVQRRRLQYAWHMGGKFEGEEDGTLQPTAAAGGRNLTVKNNHQTLLREVTYDPRLGILNFKMLRQARLRRSEMEPWGSSVTMHSHIGYTGTARGIYGM